MAFASMRLAVFGVLTFFDLACLASSQSNLRAGPSTVREAVASLDKELSGTVDRDRIVVFKEGLRPTYEALPKNANGFLGHQSVRYLLHRFFVQRHGWQLRGLEPNGDVWHTRSSDAKLEDWAPPYLVETLEARMKDRGVDLDDLAALGAALEDVVNQDAMIRLKEVYRALEVDPTEMVNRAQASDLVSTFMIVHMMGSNFTFQNSTVAAFYKEHWTQVFANWGAAENWLRELEHKRLGNMTKGQLVDFDAVARIAVDIGQQYAAFNEIDCSAMKSLLTDIPNAKAGRVRLADFYNKSLYSNWRFAEKKEYLDTLGAIDDTNVSDPLVIVPNYIGSRPNCLQASPFYDVCCRNECEDLMGLLERSIAEPRASPSRIAELVQVLPTRTVHAPRVLPSELRSRLDDIGKRHGGDVILHGRLFSQWMHHAFPNECPFPHEAGTKDPLTPDEWMDKEVTLSEDELRQYVEENCAAEMSQDSFTDLPWTHTEELLQSPASVPSASFSRKPSGIRTLVFLVIVGLVVYELFRSMSSLQCKEKLPI